VSEVWIFDKQHYQALNAAREQVVARVLPRIKESLGLSTVLDLGCGVGHFSNILKNMGFKVVGVDARTENVEEARRRYPELSFAVADAEDPGLRKLGTFDLVFCFGLLYHLENPFRVIRNISAMTSKLGIMEGICYPCAEPVLSLLDEGKLEDQGVNYMAFYPSEAALVKMFRRAGFSECYLPSEMPAHPEYQQDQLGFRRRTLLVASKLALASSALRPWPDPSPPCDPRDMVLLLPTRGRSGRLYTLIERVVQKRRVRARKRANRENS
jgi:SAM-dependent methyltransferase